MKRKKEDCKKAQAAMEFLMTYGWAILVGIIALGALAYFGVFNMQMFLPEKCVIEPTSGLFCEDFTADDVNDITLRIKNVMKKDVNILDIVIITGLGQWKECYLPGDESKIIPGGSFKDFNIGDVCDLEAGDKIKGTINILYESEGFRKTVTGTLTLYVNSAGGGAEGPDQTVCKHADEAVPDLCGGLDFVFGQGYQDSCCDDFDPGLCC